MSLLHAARRAAIAMLPPAVFLAFTAYFAWNVMRGDHGLKTYAVRQQQLVAAQAERATAEAERDAWEKRVSGLRNNHIDTDTLDERARAMLNLADPNDIVVPYGQKKLF
jgi:cell division protein FtsB